MTKKPYSKFHPGKYALFIDWETSGSDFGGDSSVDYQGISFGAVIADTENWEEVDCLYCELQFDETKYKWSQEAEEIHGISRQHLATNAISREEGLVALMELLTKYWQMGEKVMICGHNVGFDIDMTMQLFKDHNAEKLIRFHHVTPDTSAIAFVLTGLYKSDDVFSVLCGIEKRETHNALDDVRHTLCALRTMKQIFELGVQNL